MNNRGFTVVEMLLAILLFSLFFASLFSLALGFYRLWEEESQGFEERQQGRLVLEVISRDLRQARFDSLKFSNGSEAEGFYRVEFRPNHDSSIRYAYYTRGDMALKGVRREGSAFFTGMSLALGINSLLFFPRAEGVEIKVETGTGVDSPLEMGTLVIPRL